MWSLWDISKGLSPLPMCLWPDFIVTGHEVGAGFMACVAPCHSACDVQIIARLTEDTMESGTEERSSDKSGAAKESTEDSDTAQGGDTEQEERPRPASIQNQFRPKKEGDFVLDVQSRQAALTEMGLGKVHAALRKQPSLFLLFILFCYIHNLQWYYPLPASLASCTDVCSHPILSLSSHVPKWLQFRDSSYNCCGSCCCCCCCCFRCASYRHELASAPVGWSFQV